MKSTLSVSFLSIPAMMLLLLSQISLIKSPFHEFVPGTCKDSKIYNGFVSISEQDKMMNSGICDTCSPVTSISVFPNPVCPGNPATFLASGFEPGAILNWYDSPVAGNFIGSGISLTSGNLTSSVTYCVEQKVIIHCDTVFDYTGGPQSFIVPAGVDTIFIETIGAKGADQWSLFGGGNGGYAKGLLTVNPGELFHVYVGGSGTIVNGGYNGGGNGGYLQAPNTGVYGGGGGGASDVRNGAGTLSDRLIVAGGGGGFGSYGGASAPNGGGAGGGLTGADGGTSVYSGTAGKGGTQLMGGMAGLSGGATGNGFPGTLGTGGDGGIYWTPGGACGGGGGGGYYGGGGGSTTTSGGGPGTGGGGGSSYIGGVVGGYTQSSYIQIFNKNGKVIISYSFECTSARTCATAVIENVPPTLFCPPNLKVNCDFEIPAPDPQQLTATDNSGVNPIVSFVKQDTINHICQNKFDLIRTYQATDNCGNSATCTQVISVNDSIAPAITCPANIIVSCRNEIPPPTSSGLLISDNCGAPLTVSFLSDKINNERCPNEFQLIRTYLVTDACTNSSTCTQTITVYDNIPPVIHFSDPLIAAIPIGGTINIICPDDIIGCHLLDLDETSVIATDNCEIPVIQFNRVLIDEYNCVALGYTKKYELSWTATDLCGNTTVTNLFLEIMETDIPCFKSIYIPNVFSPNGDGTNDEVGPFINGIVSDYHFIIFDRWGNEIFETNSYGENWEGNFRSKPALTGVYVYGLTFRVGGGEIKKYAGSITLLR